MNEIFNSIDDEQKQPSIMVPMDDLDTAEHAPDTVDELAMELATIKQPAKRIAIIGSRNLAITHQQMIETLATALVMQGNTIITSGGSSGTNAAKVSGENCSQIISALMRSKSFKKRCMSFWRS